MKKTFLVSMLLAAATVLSAHNEKWVNMFLGSAGDHGQVTPAAAVPFGMVAVCPDMAGTVDRHGGYDYEKEDILGISINRISGVGCQGTGGNLRVCPVIEPESLLSIDRQSQKAVPGYYEAMLKEGMKIRLTSTRNVALESFEDPWGHPVALTVDFSSAFAKPGEYDFSVASDRLIKGWVTGYTACNRGTYKLWFELWTSEPFSFKERNEALPVLDFGKDVTKVEVRIAISPVSPEDAADALASCSSKSFDTVRKDAAKAWASKLDKISVKGGTEEQKVLFYTSLYRVYLSPWDVTSQDGKSYFGTDGKVHSLENGQRHYSTWSMWDTFRTKFPMLVILEPEVSRDIAQSLVDLYAQGKGLWATPYESGPSVRTEHSGICILDAWNKGITDVDLARGYQGMVKELTQDLPRRSLDNRIETSYDAWALARIASILGKEADSKAFDKDAEDAFTEVWRSEFMNITPNFAQMRGAGLYQGTRWQYRWAAPQYLDKMAEWKGKDVLVGELERFFAENHFNQGNEPDIHTPFIFSSLGRPDLTSDIVCRLLTDENMVHVYGGSAEYPEPYVGRAFRNAVDGYALEMDEDDGTMSAWYMFAQMGFYPVVVGTDRYELFSPYFDKVTICTSKGVVHIGTKGRKAYGGHYKSVSINGKQLTDCSFSHADLFGKGGRLVFKY